MRTFCRQIVVVKGARLLIDPPDTRPERKFPTLYVIRNRGNLYGFEPRALFGTFLRILIGIQTFKIAIYSISAKAKIARMAKIEENPQSRESGVFSRKKRSPEVVHR